MSWPLCKHSALLGAFLAARVPIRATVFPFPFNRYSTLESYTQLRCPRSPLQMTLWQVLLVVLPIYLVL